MRNDRAEPVLSHGRVRGVHTQRRLPAHQSLQDRHNVVLDRSVDVRGERKPERDNVLWTRTNVLERLAQAGSAVQRNGHLSNPGGDALHQRLLLWNHRLSDLQLRTEGLQRCLHPHGELLRQHRLQSSGDDLLGAGHVQQWHVPAQQLPSRDRLRRGLPHMRRSGNVRQWLSGIEGQLRSGDFTL